MVLSSLPVEILFYIGDYLDYKSVLKIRRINSFFDFVFGYVAKIRLSNFLQECDIKNIDVSDLTNISTTILVNMLFFIRKHMSCNLTKMITINITNTFLKYTDYKTYNTLGKYNFLISGKIFSEIQFDRLVKELCNSKICDRNVVMNTDRNIMNTSSSPIVLVRTDYNVLYERFILDRRDDKYMVSFYIFV